MKSRTWLVWSAGGAALLASLVTAAVQSENHARANDLALVQRRCEMTEAANAQATARVRAHVPGQPNAPLARRGAKPASASRSTQ